MIALRGIVKKEEDKNWVWRGIWTFGTLPDDEEAALHAKNPSVRPFSYSWQEARQASDVLVPSANIEQVENKNDELVSDSKQVSANEGSAEAKDDGTTGDDSKPVGTSNIEPTPMQVDGASDSKKEVGSKVESTEKKETTEKVKPDEPATADTAKSNKDTAENMAEKSTVGDATPNSLKDPGGEPGENESSEVRSTEKSQKVTFATTSSDEPLFTDASTKNPEKCPPGGAWNGYFETATNRKDKPAQIPEKFCLFFNSTPAKDARVLFPSTDSSKDTKDAMLPAGHVHVRGSGSNQYGTWELIGSLNMETGVLECQRMYVKSKLPGRRGRPRKSDNRKKVSIVGGEDGTTPTLGIGGRSTRKRQLSWRKRASLNEDDDSEVSSRCSSTGSMGKTPAKPPGTGKRGRPRKYPLPETPVGFTPPPGTIVSMPSTGSKRSPLPSPRVPAKSAMTGPKKRAKASPPAASSSAVKLPKAGDPNDARWRSAHFLYYQRNEPSSDDEEGGSSDAASSFVVYEGEMLQGYCLRDGRGVCLYNNGTLYEGEWKRNKEHGRGTLMTADRKKIIYTGEWERGRMHGKGVYYYTQDDPYATSSKRKDTSPREQQLGSRYEGEFRENARHGNGKYYLPNGSVYDGEWREDVMSGRGSFTWPDGSIYIGSWKDGKRNGSGELKASDGFTYDGNWVENAMEGRGIATYPGGQRYEGLFTNGRREGRGSIHFANGAVYEGRFRDDCMEGQGTMKMTANAPIPRRRSNLGSEEDEENDEDWMIPISFQSDMGHIHQKAGFTLEGE